MNKIALFSLSCLLFLGCEKIYDPVYSGEPDIIYTSFEDGDQEIYGVNLSGSFSLKLTNNSIADNYPIILPFNSKIVYQSNYKLFLMNLLGTKKQFIANSKALFGPINSHSGDFIIFGDKPKDSLFVFDLFKYEFPTKRITNLTQGGTTKGNIYHASPSISSDDNKIVYEVTLTQNVADTTPATFKTELFIMDADGQNPTRITYSDEFFIPIFPRFARNGEKVVFRNRDELYLINPDGSNKKSVFPNQEYLCRKFEIHPNGDNIVFSGTHQTDSTLYPGYPGIFSYNIATEEVREIVTSNATSFFHEFEISFNGKILVYYYQGDLFRANFDGTNIKKIASINTLIGNIRIRPF